MKLRPLIKCHGGKHYLQEWIIANFPLNYQQLTYCEPFCGGASVLLNKEPSPHEIISDIDRGLITIFKAVRDEPKEFLARVKRVKYSERTFTIAKNRCSRAFDDYIDQAVSEYIVRRMSRGGLKKTFGWSKRMRGGRPGDENAWVTMLSQIPEISERLRNVTILNEDFRNVIKMWDEENTLIYLDPTYLPSTRSEGCRQMYEHEMSVDDHVALLNFAKNSRAKVMISGYPSAFYSRALDKSVWRTKKIDIANHSSQAKTKERRVEIIWYNY